MVGVSNLSVRNENKKCGSVRWTSPMARASRWGKLVSVLDLGTGGAFFKPCFACQSLHGNPVINRNGADEVETKMRKEGASSRAGLTILEQL